MFGAQGRRQMRAGGGGRGREMAGRLNLDKKKKGEGNLPGSD